MTTIEEATTTILQQAFSWGSEFIHFENALGRITAQDIVADTDLPPFDRVMMDGVAIRKEVFDKGHRNFQIEHIQRAGEEKKMLSETNNAIEIMTGAMLPDGANAIVPYESIEVDGSSVHILSADIRPFQNIHLRGSDKRKGDILVKRGSVLSATELGIAASVGCTQLEVFKLPRIHFFSTGDELVEPHETPKPFQIRRSNVFAVQKLLKGYGIETSQSHLPDELNSTVDALKKALSENDIVLLTGGVSKGKYDLIPEALKTCGVKQLFHRISQRPGKPLWFGKKGKVVVFGFPGNPVSTVMCAVRYLIPFIQKSLFQDALPRIFLRLTEDFMPHPSLTYFLQVKIKIDETGTAWAIPCKGNGSGDYSNLAEADAFLQVEASHKVVVKGTALRAFPYRRWI